MGQRLAQLAELVSAARTGEDLIRPLLKLLAHSTGMQAAMLTTPDVEPDMQRAAFVHDEGIGIPEGLSIPWSETLCKRAFDEGRLYVQCAGTPYADLWVAREFNIRTFVTVPVRLDGELLGTLCALSTHEVATTSNATWVPEVMARLIAEYAVRERMIRDGEAQRSDLADLIQKDPLTRLPNRRHVLESLEQMLAWTRRDGLSLLVGYIDLDGFKAINDAHGHHVGDLFLIAMAERLRRALRGGDLLGRIGGDEFIVLAPVTASTASRSLGILRDWLTRRTNHVFDLGGTEVDYRGASVGMVLATGEDSVEDVIARADAAMYEIKRLRREAPAEMPAPKATEMRDA